MPCERYREALAEAAAGEPLSPALVGHLEGCKPCRGELRALRGALDLFDEELGAVAAMEPSPGLLGRIRRIERRQSGSARWRGVWPATAAAALAIAVALTARRADSPLPGSQVSPTTTAPGTGDATAVPPPEAPVIQTRGAASAEPHVASAPERVPSGSTRPAESAPPRFTSGAEVLVPPGQARALLSFVVELQGRAVTQDSLLVRDPWAPLAAPRPIDVVPLDTVRLDRSSG